MAAGAGLTAAADGTLTHTIVGTTSGTYPAPANCYVGLFNTQFTAAAKAGATEWVTSSDTSYARQLIGANGANWTINAYVTATGVTFTNTNQLTFPAVAGANQTLNSVAVIDTVGPTGGNIDLFADLNSPVTVNIGISVVLPATSPGPPGLLFTTF